MRNRILTALLCVALPLSSGAQTFEESVTISWIEVPVTVIGRDGAPVRGLTRDHFELYDGGEKRVIESIDVIDFSSPAAAVPQLHPEARRKFLLLFDLSYSSPMSLAKAQEAARDFAARSIGQRDLVAVGCIDADRGVRFLTAFTTDRNALAGAIADPRNFQAFDPLQIAGDPSPPPQRASIGETEGSRREADAAADLERMQAKMDREHQRNRIRRQVDLLGNAARALQGLAGRKHMVLLSEGFDPRLVTGRDASESHEQFMDDHAVTTGEVWKVDSDQRFGHAGSQRAIAEMAEAFRRADVVLHAVDILGVRVRNEVRGGSVLNSNEGLFLLANAAGGTVFRNSNDIAGEFGRLIAQQELIYVIGFRAPAGKAGEFNELKVRLIGVPGARVQHRGGYYGAGSESAVERSLSAAEVIINDIPQRDIALSTLVRPFPTDAGAQVPVIVEIAGADLVRHARNARATTDILVYAFDADGLVRDSAFQRVTLDMAQVSERLLRDGIRFYATLDLPPGPHAIKTLVRIEESEKKGFQRTDLTVAPPGDAVLLEPLFFGEPGDWIMVKAANEDPKRRYPFVLGGESFIPAARAELRAGAGARFAVFVYNAAPDEMVWEITPAASLVSRTDTAESSAFVFALDAVAAGTRELAVTIRKRGSAEQRHVSIPLFVR